MMGGHASNNNINVNSVHFDMRISCFETPLFGTLGENAEDEIKFPCERAGS